MEPAHLFDLTEGCLDSVFNFFSVNERALLKRVCQKLNRRSIVGHNQVNELDMVCPCFNWRQPDAVVNYTTLPEVENKLKELRYVTILNLHSKTFDYDLPGFLHHIRHTDAYQYIEHLIIWNKNGQITDQHFDQCEFGDVENCQMRNQRPVRMVNHRTFREIKNATQEDESNLRALNIKDNSLKYSPEPERCDFQQFVELFPLIETLVLPYSYSWDENTFVPFQNLPNLKHVLIFTRGGDSGLTVEQIESLPLEQLTHFVALKTISLEQQAVYGLFLERGKKLKHLQLKVRNRNRRTYRQSQRPTFHASVAFQQQMNERFANDITLVLKIR